MPHNVGYILQYTALMPKILVIMRQRNTLLFPRHGAILAELGENISLAIRRRKLSMTQVAERANMCRETLGAICKGNPGAAMGNYLLVLAVLGLEKDLLHIARDDVMGRKIQDAGLPVRIRAAKRKRK